MIWQAGAARLNRFAIFSILAAASLASCSKPNPIWEQAKTIIGRQLLDPFSAKYSDVKIKVTPPSSWVVCGWINSKNSFGAFTGANKFVAFDNATVVIGDAAGTIGGYWDFCQKNGEPVSTD